MVSGRGMSEIKFPIKSLELEIHLAWNVIGWETACEAAGAVGICLDIDAAKNPPPGGYMSCLFQLS